MSIQRISYENDFRSVEFLETKINQLDSKISETTRMIFQAQLVRVRSFLSKNNSFLEGIQRNFVEKSANNALHWHQSNLHHLLNERNSMQNKLDRITGKYWIKRIKRFFSLLLISLSLIVFALVFMLGIFATIYMIPFLILVIFIFYCINFIKVNRSF